MQSWTRIGLLGGCLLLGVLSVGAAVGAAAGAAAAQDAEPDASRGLKLLRMQGCTACHSLDGSRGAGPSLAGRMHRATQVMHDAQPAVRIFDAAYVARSLLAPDDDVALGYPAGVMPPYQLTDEQRDALVHTLEMLPGPASAPGSDSRTTVVLALLTGVALLGGTLWWWARRRVSP